MLSHWNHLGRRQEYDIQSKSDHWNLHKRRCWNHCCTGPNETEWRITILSQLTPGQQVTVTVKHALWHVRDRYAFHIPETVTYSGTVTRESWFDSNEIGITTDVKWYPVRQIRINRIVKIGDKPVQLEPKTEDKKVITVSGSKGNTYTVTKEFGRTSCTCTGYTFRKTCKHLSLV